jgi:hypothetical protein
MPRIGGGRAMPWPDSGSSPSLARGRDNPDRWAPPVSERKKVKERGGVRVGRWARGRRRGAGCWTRPRGGGKKRKKGQLGCTVREKKREVKEKERVDRALREKEGEKELHSNAFEFEFGI